MKKFFSYLIVIVITYAIAAYINNPELRKKLSSIELSEKMSNILSNIFQKRLQEEVVIKNMYIKSKLVYVKKEPKDTAEILGTLKKGTEVGLITLQDDWAKIKTPAGVSGWVSVGTLSETPIQISKKEATKKEEAQQEEQTYRDLSSAETEKIPSSVVSIFDAQVQPTEELPDIIKQELSKQTTTKTTTRQKIKTETKTEQQKISQETPSSVSISTSTQQETKIKEKPKKETTTKSSDTEEVINCPNCAAEVIKGERFCPICREPLSK